MVRYFKEMWIRDVSVRTNKVFVDADLYVFDIAKTDERWIEHRCLNHSNWDLGTKWEHHILTVWRQRYRIISSFFIPLTYFVCTIMRGPVEHGLSTILWRQTITTGWFGQQNPRRESYTVCLRCSKKCCKKQSLPLKGLSGN